MNAKRFSRTGPRAATTRLGRRAASRPRVPTPAWSAWLVLVSAISLSAPAPAMGAPRNLVIDADYFVDQTNAACSDAGAGTQAQPYCTITAALAAHHGPGAVINVMPGHYREQVTLPASGASGSLIILKANPSPGQPVIVDGTDDFSSTALWTQSSGDEWLAASVTWAPKQVFADDARLTPATASPGSLPPRSFTYVAGSGLYVNAGGGNPGSHGAQVGHRLYGFYVSGKSYVHIEGFTVLRGDDRCIQLTNGATNVEIVGNRVREAGRMGIQVVGGSAVRIAANVVSDNGDHGIALITGATGCTIEDNESFRNSYALARQANGLYMFGCPSNVIQRNRWHDNQDTGEHMQSGSDNNLSIQNISWANGDHGYDRFSCSGNIQIGDVAYGNYKDGFSIEGNSPNHQLFNSIAVDNGLTTNEADLWVDQGSSSGFVSDYNIFWNSTSQAPIKYIAFTPYSTISAYSAVSGQDTHSIQADPKFVASASGDFHLLAGSPAIDDANSGVANWPSTDAEGNARVDDRHTPNTGLGPVPYADRGALEFQPPPNQPPIAALTVTPSSGTEPLGVTADASASTDPDGTIASYRFDFGDGTMVGPQPGATATHTYAAGNWTATVEVTDSDGAIATKSAAVTVSPRPNQPPTAALTVTPSSGTEPLGVTADASGSSDPDGTIASYRFDFGDGTAVGPTPVNRVSHTYAAGNWTASVQVTDNGGASATKSVTVAVARPNQPPTAALTVTPSSGTEPLGVTADASGSSDPDGTIASYRFDFGDGTVVGPQPGATATHTYAAGSWTATVQVTDNAGASSTASAAVSVSAANLVGNPSFEANTDGWAPIGGATLARAPGGSSGIFSLQVKSPLFGTTPYGVTDQPDWVTSTPGAGVRYHLKAWVKAAVGSSLVSIRLRESLGSTAGQWIESPRLALSPSWQALELDYVTRWAGSDLDLQIVGQPAVLQQAFLVDDVSITLPLSATANLPPTAALVMRPSSGTEPLPVTADASGSSDPEGQIASYRFDFGDGTVVGPQPAATATHTYAAGTWTPTVQVTDAGGVSATTSGATVTVAPHVNLPPIAALAVTPSSGMEPLEVKADASGSSDPDGAIASYRFDFDDGTVVGPQVAATATHTYAAGNWTAIVQVTDAEGLSTTKSVAVSVAHRNLPPIAALAVTPASGTEPLDVTADASASSDPEGRIASYHFDFGDGTAVGPQPVATATHTYAAGNWTAIVQVTDAGGLSCTKSVAVSVAHRNLPPIAALAVTPSSGTEPLDVTADASGSSDPEGSIASYRFDFGDGTVVGPQPAATATHTYAAGNWTASVQVTDAGGLSATQSVAVSVLPSNVNLVGNPSFESDISGWAAIGGAALARVPGGSDGSYSLRVASPLASTSPYGVTDQPAWVATTPAAGARYRIGAWVRADLGTSIVSLRVRESLGGTVGAWVESSRLALSLSWQVLQIDYVTRWAGSTLDLQVVGQPAAAQQAFRVDDVSILRPPTGSQVPLAVLSLSPPTGTAPLRVTADASASIIPTGTVASYRFDFGDGTVVGPQPSATAEHIYPDGQWTASVEVSAGSGTSCGFSQAVSVGAVPNLVRGSSFETDMSGWVPVTEALLSMAAQAYDGSHSLEVGGVHADSRIFGVTDMPKAVPSNPAAGTTYRIQACLRDQIAAGAGWIRVREDLNGKRSDWVTSRDTTLSASWTLVQLDYRSLWTGSTLDFQIVGRGTGQSRHGFTKVSPAFCVDAIYIVAFPPAAAPASSAIAARSEATSADASRTETTAADATLADATPATPMPGMAPNPLRSEARLAFATARDGRVSVGIFDLAGRRVRRLQDGPMAAGLHAISFDGRDDDGARLRNGVYCYRIGSADGSRAGRFAILR